MSGHTRRRSPYVGLAPYREDDAQFFFGRQREIEIIKANLMASRLTLLYGPPGVGKSSVLQAGVAFQLRQVTHATAAANRLAYTQIPASAIDQPEFAVVFFNEWHGDPTVGLVECIRDSLREGLSYKAAYESADSDDLTDVVTWWTTQIRGGLLIILDQFEEYFLYHGFKKGKDSFADHFLRIVNSPLRVNFLISIREDSIAKLDRFKGRIHNLFDNYLRIEHLSPDAAREAIVGPLEKYNLISNDHLGIEEQLVLQVLRQVKHGQIVLAQKGDIEDSSEPPSGLAQYIETPCLQLVMKSLWETESRLGAPKLRLSTLYELGGAQQIVSEYLERALSSVPASKEIVAARIFDRLVTPHGAKLAQTVRDLAGYLKVPGKEIQPMLERLSASETGILRRVAPPPDQPGAPCYEISHDVLAPAVRAWGDRRQLEVERRRREARLIKILNVLVFFLLVSIVVGLFIWKQQRAAREAQREADLQTLRTQAALDIVHQQDRTVPYFKAIMRGHLDAVNTASFSSSGQLVLTASDDKTARIWDASSGEQLVVLPHNAPVTCAAFDPSGNIVVTAGEDDRAQVWEISAVQLRSAKSLRVLTGHTDSINNIAFSKAGDLVLTASVDGSARVWRLADGECIAELRGHTGVVNTAAFSPDGKYVVTASVDRTARVWS